LDPGDKRRDDVKFALQPSSQTMGHPGPCAPDPSVSKRPRRQFGTPPSPRYRCVRGSLDPGDKRRDDSWEAPIMTFRLYALQRLSAALMVPLIIGHLIVIFYATSNGLSAAEILGRTRGSLGWALFYGIFVVLAAIHGAIGLRSVLREWTSLRARAL